MTETNTMNERTFTGHLPDFQLRRCVVQNGNYQVVYRFANGYGASVVWSRNSYGSEEGFFEVAVTDADGRILYSTPITSDVVGWLDFAGVANTLEQIRNLPPR